MRSIPAAPAAPACHGLVQAALVPVRHRLRLPACKRVSCVHPRKCHGLICRVPCVAATCHYLGSVIGAIAATASLSQVYREQLA